MGGRSKMKISNASDEKKTEDAFKSTMKTMEQWSLQMSPGLEKGLGGQRQGGGGVKEGGHLKIENKK